MRAERRVFSGLDFLLHAGEALVITGRNGAGKTSLLRILAGFLRPSGGRVALTGGDPELTLGEQSHFLGHLDPVKASLSVAENLKFWATFLNGDRGRPIEPALEQVGLATIGDLPAAYLSAGQRRRLSLARLLAVPRPIWLLDEPTSTLDAAGQGVVSELLDAHLRDGGIALVATHLPLPLRAAQELRLS